MASLKIFNSDNLILKMFWLLLGIGLFKLFVLNLIQSEYFRASLTAVVAASLPSLVLAWRGTAKLRRWAELDHEKRWAYGTPFLFAATAALILYFELPLTMKGADANDIATVIIFIPPIVVFFVAIAYFVGWLFGKSMGGASMKDARGFLKLAAAVLMICIFIYSGIRIGIDRHWEKIASSPSSSDRELWKAYRKGISGPNYFAGVMQHLWDIACPGNLYKKASDGDIGLLEKLAGNPSCPRDILLELNARRSELGLTLHSSEGGWEACWYAATRVCVEKVPVEFTKYWFNHPLCLKNTECGNRNGYVRCNNTCPAPAEKDR